MAITYEAWANDLLGWSHFLLALLGLVSGPLIFLWRKGNTRHRIAGSVYVISMATTNISALLIYDLTKSFNLFHFFAVFSLVVLAFAFVAIRKFITSGHVKYLHMHAHTMVWSWFGLVMAAIAEVVTRLFDGLLLGDNGWWPFLVFLGLTMAAGSWVIKKLTHKFVPAYAGNQTIMS
jgi:uncharacterized membrane protein